jgi:hypothetical protein
MKFLSPPFTMIQCDVTTSRMPWWRHTCRIVLENHIWGSIRIRWKYVVMFKIPLTALNTNPAPYYVSIINYLCDLTQNSSLKVINFIYAFLLFYSKYCWFCWNPIGNPVKHIYQQDVCCQNFVGRSSIKDACLLVCGTPQENSLTCFKILALLSTMGNYL